MLLDKSIYNILQTHRHNRHHKIKKDKFVAFTTSISQKGGIVDRRIQCEARYIVWSFVLAPIYDFEKNVRILILENKK